MILLEYLRINMKSIIKNFPLFFISYMLLPVFFTFFISTTYSSEHNGDKTNSLTVIDKDNSEASNNLINYLKNSSLSEFLTIGDKEENSEFNLVIPKGYNESINNKGNTNLTIELLKSETSYHSELTKSLIEEYHQKLYSNDNLDNVYSSSTFNITLVKDETSLSYKEYFPIAMLGFLFFILAASLINSYYRSLDIGLDTRYNTCSISQGRLFNYDFLAYTMLVFIFLNMYTLFFRFIGMSFTCNILLLFIVNIVSTIFIVSVTNLIVHFFKKTLGTFIFYILMMTQIFLGGTFSYIDNPSNLAILNIVINLYKNIEIHNSLALIEGSLFIVIIISLILYLISLIKASYFWRWRI